MKKLKLFSLALMALFCTGLWAEDYNLTAPIFADYGTARAVISKNLTGFGTLYYAAHSTTAKFDVSGGGNTYNNCYRTPKGVIAFEMPRAGKVTLKNSASSNSRTVTLHLYQFIDETAYMVFQKASTSSNSIDVWLNANCKTELAADGETTMEAHFLDLGFKKSNNTIATGSDNQKNLIPDLSQGTPVTTAGENLYSSFWAPASAISVPRYELTTIEINDGDDLPAGKYLLGLNDSGSGVGIYEIVFSLAKATFSISFDANGHGEAPSNITGLAKDSVIPAINKPADPTTTGYTFGGWYGNSACTGDAWTWGTSAVTKDTTLYAKWTVNTHKLTWDFDGGNTSATAGEDYTAGGNAIAYGTSIVYPADNTMTKEGKEFDRWSTDVTSMPDEDLTITAVWRNTTVKSAINYAELKGADNSGNPTVYSEGIGVDSFEPLADVEGFHFTGWSPSSISAEATGAQTITAQWTAKYAVSFNSNGGSAVATQYVVSGETAEEPTAPTKSGYAFKAWQLGGVDYNFSTPVTAAIELVATWNEIETYTAEFSYSAGIPEGWTFANAGSYADNVATVAYVGTWVANNVSTPKQAGKTTDDDVAFAKKAGACATYDLGQTTSVTALSGTFRVGSSSERTFTIEYLAANGTTVLHTISTTTNSNWGEKAVSNTTVVPNVKYIRINPAHNGDSYSWLVMQAFSVSYINTITKYNVTFSKNGGSGDDMPTLKYAEGAEVTLPPCTFTAPANKEFDAWACADSTITGGKFTMPAKNVEVYPLWKNELVRYTVSYYDGETKLGDEDVIEGESPVDYADYQAKAHYTFSKWTNNAAAEINAATLEVTQDTALYGVWTADYSTSVNIEQLVLDEGTSYDIQGAFDVANITYANLNDLDTLNDIENKTNRNYDFLGLKIKTQGGYVEMLVKNGQTLNVKFGNRPAPIVKTIDGVEQADSIKTATYSFTASGDQVVRLSTATGGTHVLKQIMINEDIKDVVLPAPGAYLVTISATEHGTVEATWPNKKYRTPVDTTVTLTATPAEGYILDAYDVYKTGDAETKVEVTDGKFTMPAYAVTVSATFKVDPSTALDNTDVNAKAVKRLENGILVIEKNGVRYNVTGQVIK